MNFAEIGTVVAVVISILTFIGSQMVQARSASTRDVDAVATRLKFVESDLEKCITARENLLRENIELLRRLVLLETSVNGKKP